MRERPRKPLVPQPPQQPPAEVYEDRHTLGDLARRVTSDLNQLARDHTELARIEMSSTLRHVGADAVGVLLGGIVSLVGFAMLCVTVAVALEPVWAPLWGRLLLCAGVYLVLGSVTVLWCVRRLRTDAPPHLDHTGREARRTVDSLREELTNGRA